MRYPRARFGVVVVSCAFALGACGGDDKEEPADAPAAAETAQALTQEELEAEVRTAIQDYYTAMRIADAETICDFETEELQQFKYNGTGQACLEDLSNNTKQFYDKKTPIVLGTVSDSGASAQVTSGLAPTSLGLVRVDGEWKINKFA